MRIYTVVLWEDELDSVYDNLEAARARVAQIEAVYGHAWFIESELRSAPKFSAITDYTDYYREINGDDFANLSALQRKGLTYEEAQPTGW